MQNYSTDWEGRQVGGHEVPETKILVWEIDPSMSSRGEHDRLLIRSWQYMLLTIRDRLDSWLESIEPAELREGVELKIRLVEMELRDYREAIEQ